MAKPLLIVLLAALALLAGCKNPDAGSREFIPGRGWIPVNR